MTIESDSKPKKNNCHPAMSGDDLRAIRTKMGLTQDEFSAMLGIKTGKYSKWEQGFYKISDEGVTLINLLLKLHSARTKNKA